MQERKKERKKETEKEKQKRERERERERERRELPVNAFLPTNPILLMLFAYKKLQKIKILTFIFIALYSWLL